MDEKTSCLSDKKVMKKNQVFEYHTSSAKGYDKEDTRSIDKNLLIQSGTEEENQKILSVFGEKPSNL